MSVSVSIHQAVLPSVHQAQVSPPFGRAQKANAVLTPQAQDRVLLRFAGSNDESAAEPKAEPLPLIAGTLREAAHEDMTDVLDFLTRAIRPAEAAVTRDIRPLLRQQLQQPDQLSLLRNMGLKEVELESEDTVLSGLSRVYAEHVIDNPRGSLLIAHNDQGHLAGAVCIKQFEFSDRLVSRPDSTHAWLNNLEVAPLYVNSELRKTLLDKAISKASGLGYNGVSACVLPVNRPLFDEAGFVPWSNTHPPVGEEEAAQAFQALVHIPGHPVLMVKLMEPTSSV